VSDNAALTQAAYGFFGLPLIKQLLLLVGLSLSISVGVYVVFWSQTPSFVPVFNKVDTQSAGEIIDALQKNGLAYKLDTQTGLVLVESSKIFEARIKLAQNGVAGNIGTGLELLDKKSGLGTSQFIERTRYVRGLQGELERTITSIQNIKSARVHLAIPKQSEFIRKKKNPSASVFLNLYGGYNLSTEQVAAITHLVASSIQGLSTHDVTVVDQNGNLLSSTGHDQLANASKNLDFTSKIEDMYANRINDLLEPIVGAGRIKARVTALIDFTSKVETLEDFNPKSSVVRSEKILEIIKAGGEIVGGIPGALSNEPPVTGTAPEVIGNGVEEGASPGKPLDNASANRKKQATKNYEIDRKITHNTYFPGKLIRLSVAVVIGDKITYDKKGKPSYVPITDEELNNIKKLVNDAVGYSKERNDTVTIIRSSFAEEAPIADLAEESILEKSWFMPLVKNVLAGIAFLALIFIVLRPIIKNLTKVAHDKRDMLKLSDPEAQLTGNTGSHGLGATPLIQVKDIVNEDPKIAAQVIRKWVEAENG